jgi:vacuolar protein sorting-associated protein 35
MAVFDSLRFLSTYIKEAHLSGKQHCADLYEIVQYAGNIVPRMYLMITVGRYLPGYPQIPWIPLMAVFIWV